MPRAFWEKSRRPSSLKRANSLYKGNINSQGKKKKEEKNRGEEGGREVLRKYLHEARMGKPKRSVAGEGSWNVSVLESAHLLEKVSVPISPPKRWR